MTKLCLFLFGSVLFIAVKAQECPTAAVNDFFKCEEAARNTKEETIKKEWESKKQKMEEYKKKGEQCFTSFHCTVPTMPKGGKGWGGFGKHFGKGGKSSSGSQEVSEEIRNKTRACHEAINKKFEDKIQACVQTATGGLVLPKPPHGGPHGKGFGGWGKGGKGGKGGKAFGKWGRSSSESKEGSGSGHHGMPHFEFPHFGGSGSGSGHFEFPHFGSGHFELPNFGSGSGPNIFHRLAGSAGSGSGSGFGHPGEHEFGPHGPHDFQGFHEFAQEHRAELEAHFKELITKQCVNSTDNDAANSVFKCLNETMKEAREEFNKTFQSMKEHKPPAFLETYCSARNSCMDALNKAGCNETQLRQTLKKGFKAVMECAKNESEKARANNENPTDGIEQCQGLNLTHFGKHGKGSHEHHGSGSGSGSGKGSHEGPKGSGSGKGSHEGPKGFGKGKGSHEGPGPKGPKGPWGPKGSKESGEDDHEFHWPDPCDVFTGKRPEHPDFFAHFGSGFGSGHQLLGKLSEQFGGSGHPPPNFGSALEGSGQKLHKKTNH